MSSAAPSSSSTSSAPSRDTRIENIPHDVSIWEAATYGRKIILDNVEATLTDGLTRQRASEATAAADAATKEAKKQGKTARDFYTPSTMEVVSDDQPSRKNVERYRHLEQSILKGYKERLDSNVPIGSSLPHLSQAGADGRAQHVTSSRVVGTAVDDGVTYTVHERFHQDQGQRSGSEPSHDRFFATNSNGGVHGVTAKFKAANPGKLTKEEHPLEALYQATVSNQRNKGPRPLLNSKVHEWVDWTVVKGVEPKQPPLSPKSQQRRLPDSGYGLPRGHGKK